MRYLSDGSLDASFDLDGKARVAIGTGDEEANGAALLPDGRIVAGGYSGGGAAQDFAVVRIWP